jgi:hypothetical protein
VERFEATLTREGAFTAGSSSLNQTIQTRTAGLVNAFRVLERREMQGMLQVAIEAEVCMDARIAVRWLGPMQGEEAFLLAFRQAMGETGWQVIPLPRQPLGQGMQLLFDTGATHLATVEARATPAGELLRSAALRRSHRCGGPRPRLRRGDERHRDLHGGGRADRG